MKFQWFLWPLVAMVLAVVLFQVKQNARAMERELARVRANIENTEQSLEVLRAEWSHLNQPSYLKTLATRHLDYDPEVQTRIIKLSDLPVRDRDQRNRQVQRSSATGTTTGAIVPQPAPPTGGGNFRHVSEIDLIGSMINNELQGQ